MTSSVNERSPQDLGNFQKGTPPPEYGEFSSCVRDTRLNTHSTLARSWSKNLGTIHIHKVLRYLHACIKRAAISAVQQPSESHGANLRKEGIWPVGGKPALVLPNISRASSPPGGSMSSHDLFSVSGSSPTQKKKTAIPKADFRLDHHGSIVLIVPLCAS